LPAISEHQRQNELIRQLQALNSAQQNEIEMLRRELQERMHGAPPPRPADPYAGDQFGRPRPPELPPLRSLQSAAPPSGGPESMTGVQYEAPRANGYRTAEPTRF
jgi:hypothetical protein